MPAHTSTYKKQDRLAELGKALVAQLFILFKNSYHYSETHTALDAPLSNVLNVVREIIRNREEATVRIQGEQLFLGDLRLKTDAAYYEAARFVMEEMKRHLIGAVSFNFTVTTEDLRRFVYALRENDGGAIPETYTALLLRLQQRMIANIEVETLSEQGQRVATPDLVGEKEVIDKLKVRALYQKALTAMEDVMTQLRGDQPLRLRGPKRVVQRLIDLLPAHEATLLGLTTLRCREQYTQNHAVHVCILSLIVGKRLGLSKFHLSELGMAALFHDVGKVELPGELLNKRDELSAGERASFEKHPLLGVKKVMRLKGLDVMTARIVTGIFEHHLLADYSGYPRLPYRRLSLLGRVISIADRYDELTSSRVHGRKPLPPTKALRQMMAESGKSFDPALLKLFMSCVGIHGIGALLLLDTRELAVVVQNHQDSALWDHPKVKIIADAAGREVDGEILDLAEPGSPLVLANLDANSFGLDVSRYL